MIESNGLFSHLTLLISCNGFLTACSGTPSILSQSSNSIDEPTEVTADALDESSFDYESLYADGFRSY